MKYRRRNGNRSIAKTPSINKIVEHFRPLSNSPNPEAGSAVESAVEVHDDATDGEGVCPGRGPSCGCSVCGHDRGPRTERARSARNLRRRHDDAARAAGRVQGPREADAGRSEGDGDVRGRRQGKRRAAPDDPNRAAPPVGGDTSPVKSYLEQLWRGGGGVVGGYNQFWLAGGIAPSSRSNGEKRTSIIVDPPDGHVPPMKPEAPRAQSRASRRRRRRARRRANPVRAPGPSRRFDDPESRPLAERCLLGFGSTSGPPTLPNYFYNNLKQIVQTPTTRDDPQRDGARRARRPHRRHAPAADASAGGWATPSATGKATRSSSTPTNFTDKTQFQRIERQAARRRALHADRREDDPLSLHDRRSRDLGSVLDRRVSVGAHRRDDLRIRLPRRQSRARERAARRPREGEGNRHQSSDDEVPVPSPPASRAWPSADAGDRPAPAPSRCRWSAQTICTAAVLEANGRGGLALLDGYLSNLRAARQQDGGAVLLLDAATCSRARWNPTSPKARSLWTPTTRSAIRPRRSATTNSTTDPWVSGRTSNTPGDDPRGALKARLSQSHFPWVASNLLDAGTRRPVAARTSSPSTVFTLNGVRIGVVGLITKRRSPRRLRQT